MRSVSSLVAALALSSPLSAQSVSALSDYPTIPIFDAAEYTSVVNSTDNGSLLRVSVPADGDASQEQQGLHVLHVYGSPKEMGRAHGQLMGEFALEFLDDKMDDFFRSEFEGLDLSGLPKWIQDLYDATVVKEAPEVFAVALSYVLAVQKPFLDASPSKVLEELEGMAQGLCESGAPGVPMKKSAKADGAMECDVEKLTHKITLFNLLPELIRMSCSIVGATGKATPSGGLNQLRALDFGGGPFANYSLLTVYHPDVGNPFANIGFAGFSNLVTGVSGKVGVSEKVHEVYNNGTGLQPGTYKGRSVAMVMREMLQFANSTQDAIDYARAADRTWSVFLGFGDSENNFDVLEYRHESVDVFDWHNISNITDSVQIPDITFVDRHPQPTHEPDMMPTILKEHYGNLSVETIAQLPQQLGPTGDVHVAIYDYPNHKMLMSVGLVDENGTYGNNNEGMACNRPFLRFDLDSLWDYKPTSAQAQCGQHCDSDADCTSGPCNHCEKYILHQCVT